MWLRKIEFITPADFAKGLFKSTPPSSTLSAMSLLWNPVANINISIEERHGQYRFNVNGFVGTQTIAAAPAATAPAPERAGMPLPAPGPAPEEPAPPARYPLISRRRADTPPTYVHFNFKFI
jgi:hypothetical protein